MAYRDARAASAPILSIANSNNEAQAPEVEREKSKFWINNGVTVQGEFIQLAGLAFDDVSEPVVPNPTANNAAYRATQERKRKLYNKMKTTFEAMEPGEVREVTLTVQLRRIKEEPVEVNVDDHILDEIDQIQF